MQAVWGLTSKLGLRPTTWLSVPYRDTLFCYRVAKHPGVRGHVALTIDDGICRNGPEESMGDDVRELLEVHDAKATFFLCSDYMKGPELEEQARRLVADGHEFANHCTHDSAFSSLSPEEFESTLVAASTVIEAFVGEGGIRWFRAPQARYSKEMRKCIQSHGMKHALGDTYCDDWMEGSDPDWIARTMLRQVRDGSICIVHMPEKNYRNHCFHALKKLLEGLQSRGLRAVTLTKLEALAAVGSIPRVDDHGADGCENTPSRPFQEDADAACQTGE